MQSNTSNNTVSGVNFGALEYITTTKAMFGKSKMIQVLLVIAMILCAGFIVTPLPPLRWVGLTGVIILAFYIAKITSERDKKLWRQFARDNNWTIKHANTLSDYVPPALLNIGKSPTVSEVIEGRFNDCDFRIFTFSYNEGNKNNSGIHKNTVMQLVYNTDLPHFIIDSRRNKSLVHNLAGLNKISLEGDFDSTFNLMAPMGSEVDVLSIISPDVMQTLIESNEVQDIEVNGAFVWLMQKDDVRGIDKLPNLFLAANALDAEFSHRIKTYKRSLAN